MIHRLGVNTRFLIITFLYPRLCLCAITLRVSSRSFGHGSVLETDNTVVELSSTFTTSLSLSSGSSAWLFVRNLLRTLFARCFTEARIPFGGVHSSAERDEAAITITGGALVATVDEKLSPVPKRKEAKARRTIQQQASRVPREGMVDQFFFFDNNNNSN